MWRTVSVRMISEYGISTDDMSATYVSYGDRARGGDNGNSKTPSDQRKQ